MTRRTCSVKTRRVRQHRPLKPSLALRARIGAERGIPCGRSCGCGIRVAALSAVLLRAGAAADAEAAEELVNVAVLDAPFTVHFAEQNVAVGELLFEAACDRVAGSPTIPGSEVAAPMSKHIEESNLESDVRCVARRLQADLRSAIARLADEQVRPASLVRALSVDDTLAARIVRAIRAPDPLVGLLESPAPGGLRIFLGKARAAGVDTDVCDALSDTITRFESLLTRFPERRSALDAAISGWVPEVKERRERAGKQAIYKALSYLQGCRADAVTMTHILRPSSGSHATWDQILISSRHGLRRLRPAARVAVFGVHMADDDCPGPDPYHTSIDGSRLTGDPNQVLLKEFCSEPLPKFAVVVRGRTIRYALADKDPPINVPVDITIAHLIRDASAAHQTEQNPDYAIASVVRLPAKVLVVDVLLHKDIPLESPPTVTTRLYGMPGPLPSRDDALVKLDDVDISASIEYLGQGLDHAACVEVRSQPDIIAAAMSRAGWDSEQFHVFRSRIVYPVPFFHLTTWIRRPSA